MGASRARQNAMRSGLVVLGSIAFGYLSLQVGFKPYLERARDSADIPESDPVPESNSQPEGDLSVSFPQEEKRNDKATVLEGERGI